MAPRPGIGTEADPAGVAGTTRGGAAASFSREGFAKAVPQGPQASSRAFAPGWASSSEISCASTSLVQSLIRAPSERRVSAEPRAPLPTPRRADFLRAPAVGLPDRVGTRHPVEQ
jgi:hypothetical protein